jgi:hypothetical protein
MKCKPQELREFIKSSKPDACGFISFYWGQTVAELEPSRQPGDVLLREWLGVFQESRK